MQMRHFYQIPMIHAHIKRTFPINLFVEVQYICKANVTLLIIRYHVATDALESFTKDCLERFLKVAFAENTRLYNHWK